MRIVRVEGMIVDMPVRVSRQMSKGISDTGPAGSPRGKPVMLKITSDEGISGWGRITSKNPFMPETSLSMLVAMKHYYGPQLIGEDPLALDRIFRKFDRVLPANPCARGLIDMALHDLVGKALGVPVYDLLGGRVIEKIPLEWSVSYNSIEQMVEDCRRAYQDYGIQVVCLKAGISEDWREDVARVAAVREALGADLKLGIDVNEAWEPATAIPALRAMADYNLDYVEQPVAARNIAGLAEVRQATGVRVTADESVQTLDDAFALAERHAVDILCMKFYKVGGMRVARKIAIVAEAARLSANIGGTAPLSLLEAAAGAHFYVATPNIRPGAEFVLALGPIGKDPYATCEGFEIDNGHVTPPVGPGLGVTVDEEAVNKGSLERCLVE